MSKRQKTTYQNKPFKQPQKVVTKRHHSSLPGALYASPRTGATELKCVDTAAATYNLNTTAVFTALNIPVEGAAFYQRIGRRIRMKSLHIRGYIIPSNANTAAIEQDLKRIMVIYDRQANGSAPVLADVLTGYASDGSTNSNASQHLNMNNRDRFVVLMDLQVLTPALGINGASAASTATIAADINANCGTTQGTLNINRYIRLKGLETHFKASAGSIGDIATGSLLLMTVGLNDTNATSAWQLGVSTRLKFYD